jgi:hypothetical protein
MLGVHPFQVALTAEAQRERTAQEHLVQELRAERPAEAR